MDIKNYLTVVIGGASGLGKATCDEFFKRKTQIVILDKNISEARKLAKIYKGYAFECDISDEKSILSALAKIKKLNKDIRVVINCAGILISKKIISKDSVHSLEDFEKVIKINLIGTFNILRLFGQVMQSNKPTQDNSRGIIICTSSIAAEEGQIGQIAYSASKGGVNGMVLTAAREFSRFGIRVNAIAPGIFETPILGNLNDEFKQRLSSSVLFPKRLGLPLEFGKLAFHLVENDYINGTVIRIDGGVRMEPK